MQNGNAQIKEILTMSNRIHRIAKNRFMNFCFILLLFALFVTNVELIQAENKQKTFQSVEDAVHAFVTSFRENNKEELLAIFGEDETDLIYSGDETKDQLQIELFLELYDKHHKVIQEEKGHVLVIGEIEWPFPIPIIEHDGKYMFDTDEGREEILNRRVGRNELNTIQTMLAIVDAQREYAMVDRDGDGLLEYAQKFISDPDKKNGLFWPTDEGEELSPFGSLINMAIQEGYTIGSKPDRPQPYHGYIYRILRGQKTNTPGGSYDYIVNESMIGGFAAIAYPAEYGNSGVMTFMVNHLGIVYQKDLGDSTEEKALSIKLYKADETWSKVES
jgi:hypothetical protein